VAVVVTVDVFAAAGGATSTMTLDS